MASQLFARDIQAGTSMAWHQNTLVREVITKEDAFPWDVRLKPLYYKHPTLGLIPHEMGDLDNEAGHSGEMAGSQWAVPICSDDGYPVGNGRPINTKTYGLRTPHRDWDFIEEVRKGGGHTVISAGTVKNRSRHFIVLELEESSVDVGHRHFGGRFNFIGGMDVETSLVGVQSTICTVCWNTMSWNVALADKRLRDKYSMEIGAWTGAIRIPHTTKVDENLENTKGALALALNGAGIFGEAMTNLRDEKCSVDRAHQIYTGFLAPSGVRDYDSLSTQRRNQIEDCVDLFRRGRGNEGENFLDVLSGFTEFRTEGTSRNTKTPSRWASSEFGTYAAEKEKFGRILVSNRGEELEARGLELLS